jgi:hypothetical protein
VQHVIWHVNIIDARGIVGGVGAGGTTFTAAAAAAGAAIQLLLMECPR